ncbi:MAG: hypothetical protein ACRD2X_09185 [Vicinamibacteraceae bacterium]
MDKISKQLLALSGAVLVSGTIGFAEPLRQGTEVNPPASRDTRELVARNIGPGEHLRLRDHFTALAAKYTASANRHATMRLAYRNPNRRPSSSGRAHCERQVLLATESADTMRALALHHEKVAAGMPSTLPPALALESGAARRDRATDEKIRPSGRQRARRPGMLGLYRHVGNSR